MSNSRYQQLPHVPVITSRRDLLFQAGLGFGGLALSALLAEEARASETGPRNPNAESRKPNTETRTPNAETRTPHFPAKADSVIFLFMEGGPSHLDLFDPKPE